ncbi:MAG: hypothetical protein HN576_02445 [Bacteriovoracaceae bacterium]|nr:hypothetical protein [Bacteriovoracaceae bacterium]
MKIKKKYYLSLVIILLLMGIMLAAVSNLVSTSDLEKEIYENVSLLLEKSTIKHEKIKIEYGLNIRFIIPKLEIISTVSKKVIASVKQVEVKAPLWSLYLPSFPVSYHFKDIQINIGEQLNNVVNIKKLQERMTYKNLLGFDTFHEKSKHSIFFDGINLHSKTVDFPIQYLKLRNFSWSKFVAYEIRHQIKENRLLPDLFADYVLIGEVNLGESIERKDLRTKAQLKISKLNVGKMIDIQSLINGKIALHIGGKDILDGHISTLGEIELDSRFFLKGRVLDLLGMRFKLPVANMVVLKKILPGFKESNKIIIEGDLKGIGSDIVQPDLNFNFSESIQLSKNKFSFKTTMKGTLKEDRLDFSFSSLFSEGVINGRVRAPVYDRRTGLLFTLDKNINLNLEIKDIDLKVMALKKKSFYSLSKKYFSKTDLSKKFKKIEIKIKDCKYDKRKLDGHGVFKRDEKSLTTKDFTLNYDGGSLVTDLILSPDYIEGQLAFENFNVEGITAILEGGRLPISGTYSGKLSGVFSKSTRFSHELNINLIGRDGILTKGQSISSVGSAMAKFSPDLTLSKGANSFSKLLLMGRYANNNLIIKNITYEDKNHELKVQGTANIIITEIKEKNYIGEGSNFLINLIDQKNTLWTKKSAINLPKEVPMKIQRINQEWVPDLLYTINKIKDEQ